MRLFLALLFCYHSSFAADLPDMGDNSDAVLSPQLEKFIGARFMRQIRTEIDIIADRALNRYLHDLGQQLLSYSNTPDASFHFFFIQDSDVNAFAVPGGYIGVNSGLLFASNSEDELASVLSHEIAHVTQRHTVRSIVGASEIGATDIAAALLLALALGTGNPDAAVAGVYTLGAGNYQRYLNFTRTHEQEADRLGIHMLAKAQFKPEAMADFFMKLQKKRRFYAKSDLAPPFLQSHPVTVDRIAEAQERAESYINNQKPLCDQQQNILCQTENRREDQFALNRARLLVLSSDDLEKLARQLQANLDKKHFRSPHALRYGLALAKLALRDFTGIETLLLWLQTHGEDRILYRLLAIDIAAAQKNMSKAFALAHDALADYPNDYILSMRYAELLQQQKRYQSALELLNNLSEYQQASADYQKLLAQVLAALGQNTKALLAQAKTYFYQDRLPLAIKQLEQAQKRSDKDYYVAAQVNAYLKDWREAWDVQQRLEKEFK